MAINDTATQTTEYSLNNLFKEKNCSINEQRIYEGYKEFLSKQKPKLTFFEANGYDQMIIEKNISFYSLCEHHALPFFGNIAVGYIPNKKIIGLSKLSRICDFYACNLTTQEYLTQDICNYINDNLSPKGLGIYIKARHLCKEMRGIKKNGEMITIALKGIFFEKEVREEFLLNIK
jgi:GTP cyclohydrolase I